MKKYLKNFPGSSLARYLVQRQGSLLGTTLVVVEDTKKAEQIAEDLRFFSPQAQVEVAPAFDVRPYYGLSPHRSHILKHMRILSQLLIEPPDFLVVPKETLLRHTIPRSFLESRLLKLVTGDLIERDDLAHRLVQMGYERSSVVEEPGQFAVRGDVVDIFSPYHEQPIRVSLLDIEVESLRWFDPISQRTLTSEPAVLVIPAHEIILEKFVGGSWKSELKRRCDQRNITKDRRDQIEEYIQNKIYFHGIEFFLPLFYEKTSSLFEYLKDTTTLVCDLDNPFDRVTQSFLDEITAHYQVSDHIESIFAPDEIYLKADEVELALSRFDVLSTEVANETQTPQIISGFCESNLFLTKKISTQVSQIHTLAPLASELNQQRLKGMSCFIVCRNDIQLKRVQDLLQRFELPIRVEEPLSPHRHAENPLSLALSPGVGRGNALSDRLVTLIVGSLHEGFLSHADKQWWLTDEEVFGKKTVRAVSSRHKTTVFSSFSEIEVGDFLIHMDHGIGLYQGLKKLAVDVHQNDFLLIEYLGGDKLYVPVDRLNRVQRFVAQEGLIPQLDKLGGTTWIKTRNKAKRAARKLAAELLAMQAKRAMLSSTALTAQPDLVEEFEAGFSFEETPDQMTAIQETYRDLSVERPMDRVVCGDVGYGKTEVAMRAAFLAVANHVQVAVLVPTTILAFQHFTTFSERFKNYPVTIELLSRFRTIAEQKDVIKRVREGQVDIVIGTHRLLSKDIGFFKLGLMIVDEEHRFGVVHKERMKKMRSLVDVLTLTATPIPRTLNFALNGIRDLSIINTPPVDRLAVKTYTCYFDEGTIRDAILKEIRRGGQAFFVHNRVQSIEKMTAQVAKIIPEARVRFGHGQMDEHELEDVMLAFMRHEFDVLVCSTIIESGLDIPNANTMIINRADSLGLAQLYQLRGRVGRGNRQAYCYLVLPSDALMTTKAKQRVAVIQRFTELGSGFKVASHDLEIRGAGNILGDEQSGHIAAIGYDLYVQMLNQAIAELKHQHIPEDFEPEIQLNVVAKIPEDFIPDQKLRLVLYKQISSCESDSDVDTLMDEWADRFGKIPESVLNLSELIKIRILCKHLLINSLKQSGETLLVSFHPEHQIDTLALMAMVQKKPRTYSLTKDGRLSVKLSQEKSLEEIKSILEALPLASTS